MNSFQRRQRRHRDEAFHCSGRSTLPGGMTLQNQPSGGGMRLQLGSRWSAAHGLQESAARPASTARRLHDTRIRRRTRARPRPRADGRRGSPACAVRSVATVALVEQGVERGRTNVQHRERIERWLAGARRRVHGDGRSSTRWSRAITRCRRATGRSGPWRCRSSLAQEALLRTGRRPVWPTFAQTTEGACEGLHRAWVFFAA
jgi:hypothetical protein